ncbi:MAG: Asp-tRNA(Asn)/Glu-tRNA(Gln) amidotransferase subunit GatC [Polyangiaceae bacterium]
MAAAPKIDRAVVLHVAKLASVTLSEPEVERFASELDRILSHVQELDELDTRDVPPTAHVQLTETPWRPDELQASLPRAEALSQAPSVEDDGFAVPAFVE